MGDPSRIWCSAWKELERDLSVGSRVKQEQYWTVNFLMGEAGHIWEALRGDRSICRAHASFHPSFMLYRPGPKLNSHRYVAGRSVQAQSAHVCRRGGSLGRKDPSLLEPNHQQGLRNEGPALAIVRRGAIFIDQSADCASSRNDAWWLMYGNPCAELNV